MKLPIAIQEILEDTGYTKYKLAKALGVNSNSIDNFMSGKQKTVNKDIAENLQENFYMKLDEDQINVEEPRPSHGMFRLQTKLNLD